MDHRHVLVGRLGALYRCHRPGRDHRHHPEGGIAPCPSCDELGSARWVYEQARALLTRAWAA